MVAVVVWRRGGGAGQGDFQSGVVAAPADRRRNDNFRDLTEKANDFKGRYF